MPKPIILAVDDYPSNLVALEAVLDAIRVDEPREE